MNYMEAAFGPVEAKFKAAVTFETFGHLEPKPGIHPGWIVFINGAYGDEVAVDWDFRDVEACPGIYDDMNNWFEHVCRRPFGGQRGGKASKVGVYRFEGYYQRFKNGNGRFVGGIRQLDIVQKAA